MEKLTIAVVLVTACTINGKTYGKGPLSTTPPSTTPPSTTPPSTTPTESMPTSSTTEPGENSAPRDPWLAVQGDQPKRRATDRFTAIETHGACTAAHDHCLEPDTWFLIENDDLANTTPGHFIVASASVFGSDGPMVSGNSNSHMIRENFVAFHTVPATRKNLVPGAIAFGIQRPVVVPTNGREAEGLSWHYGVVESVDADVGVYKLAGDQDTMMLPGARVAVFRWKPGGKVEILGGKARDQLAVSVKDVFLPEKLKFRVHPRRMVSVFMADGDPPIDDAFVEARVRAARPGVDRVRMDATRARAERALFDVDAPARVGRYIVVDTAGSGGMGIVYRAYDPQLARSVALKIVRARGAELEAARERLLAEARTLAQLAHPNVLPIHDVMAIGDDLVVVMEFVDGTTLDGWVKAETRTWQDIVRVYTDAARGLAAAHAVDVIHRDFKPNNALIGTDGRVRVADFGLAQAETGTPAYMAPEQLADGSVSAASDQFSFCVALYEALLNVRPFVGDDRKGPPTPGERSIPAWLRALLVRGMAFEPGARFSSMTAVIAELVRVRGWRRWRVPAALVTLTTVAAVAVVHAQTADPLAACDGGVTEIDAAWGPVARARVTAVLARDPGAYASDVSRLTLAGLDRYRSKFIQIHRDACVDHRRGAMSSVVLDRSMVCLQHRRSELEAAVSVLGELDAEASKNAVDVVARLPPVEACGDVANLAADEPPIADPAVRTQVAALRRRLARAAALDAAARSTEAIAEARAIDREAERLGQPTIMIDAELLVGRSLVFSGEAEPALIVLAHAEELALARGNAAAAVIAAARRIYVEATTADSPPAEDALRREVSLLEPLSRSVASDGLARPLLFNNVAAAHQAMGQRAVALADLQAAHAALAAIANPDPELDNIDTNLALVTVDPGERVQLADKAWHRIRASLGPSHRQTLAAEHVLARVEPEPGRALPLIAEVCERYTRDHAALVSLRAECAYYHGWWASEAGAPAAARPFYVELAELTRKDPDLALLHDIATGEVALADADAVTALAAFRAAVTEIGATPPWWKLVFAAHARIGAARALEMSHATATVPALLDDAIALLTTRMARNEDQVPRQLRDLATRMRAGYPR